MNGSFVERKGQEARLMTRPLPVDYIHDYLNICFKNRHRLHGSQYIDTYLHLIFMNMLRNQQFLFKSMKLLS